MYKYPINKYPINKCIMLKLSFLLLVREIYLIDLFTPELRNVSLIIVYIHYTIKVYTKWPRSNVCIPIKN